MIRLKVIVSVAIFMAACSFKEDCGQEDYWYLQIFGGVMPVHQSRVLSPRVNEQGNLSAKTFPLDIHGGKADEEFGSVYILFGSLDNCAVCLDPQIHEGLYELVKQETSSSFELRQYLLGNTLVTVLLDGSQFVKVIEDALSGERGQWMTMVAGFKTIDQLLAVKR